jgi:ATP adenylyltransferase
LLNKSKAKAEALASVGKEQEGSPDHKRFKRDNGDAAGSKAEKHEQNPDEPFKPPYVPELFLGCLEGLEGEPGMSILVGRS